MTKSLRERMARAIAGAVYQSQGSTEEIPTHPVMAERRVAAEKEADAALATIEADDELGNGLVAVRQSPRISTV